MLLACAASTDCFPPKACQNLFAAASHFCNLYADAKMSWDKIYRIRSYLRSSLWVVPFFAIPLELVITRVVHWLDRTLGWSFLDFSTEGAQALFQAIVSATLAFVVFTFGFLLVAIQVASSQLTARLIATTLLRNPLVKYIVGLFIFTFEPG